MTKNMLDCRGLSCPQPVVETKKRLTDMSPGTLTVLVDNETAKNNLLRLAVGMNLDAASKEEEGIFTVTLLKGDIAESQAEQSHKKTILVTSDTFGRGSEELGGVLIKSFFYALSESDRLPESIYLINGGVKLVCVGSAILDSLEKLAALGVKIHSCGLCLDYFNMKEQLCVGEVTNMYAIVDSLMTDSTLIL